MNSELKLISPIPPSVNHYLSYRVVKSKGRYIACSYKTKEATTYQKEFEKWYFQRIRKMKYKSKKENEIFDANLVVEWLKTASPNCKAKIVEPFLNIGEEDKSLPYMYF